MTVKMLVRLGYRVEPFATAHGALAAYQAEPKGFDMVLSDVTLPGGLDGFGLADALWKISPDLKILFMSGRSIGLVPNE